MAKLKSLTGLRFSALISPFNPFCNGLRRFRVAPVALLLAASVGWSAPAASAQAVNFGSVNVCPSGATTPAPCNKTLAVSFTVPASGTLGTPEVFTQGAPNLDFTLASGSTCTGTVTEGATCAVNVTFTPLAPGQRKGGVQIVDGSGSVLANAYIYGAGVGPAIAFRPSPQIALGSGFDNPNGPNGVAVDGSGNVFVADSADDAVKEILAVNGSVPANPTIKTLGSGFNLPAGVAVDGSGNVFVADSGNNAVKEILAVNGSIPANPTIRTLTLTLADVDILGGMAVDESGNVFVPTAYDQSLEEILAVNGSIPANPTIRTLAPPFAENIGGVAVDGSENVFVTDFGNCAVYEIPAVNGSIPANPTINTVFNNCIVILSPVGVAVDGAGDVFVGDSAGDFGLGKVFEILAVNGSIPVKPIINTLGGGFGVPRGIAVDGSGDVFVADLAYSSVLEIQRSQPPSLSFLATPVGTTSSDSPQSVQIQNIGNATLSLTELSVTENFTLVPGSGTPADCTASSSLTPGAQCNLNISFTPEAVDQLTGTVTLSDNALNGNPTQTIPLTGGLLPLPQAQISSLTLQFGTNQGYLPLVITNVGAGTLSLSPTINGPSYQISYSNCAAGVTAGNSCTLRVEFSPVTIGSHVDILTLHANVSTPTVTLHGIAEGVGTKMEAPLQFGTIAFGSTKVLPLIITNVLWPGTVTIGTKINGPSYKVLINAQNTCVAGITAGHSCTLPIEFDPVSVGMHDDILTLTPSGGAAPSTVHLDGIAN